MEVYSMENLEFVKEMKKSLIASLHHKLKICIFQYLFF